MRRDLNPLNCLQEKFLPAGSNQKGLAYVDQMLRFVRVCCNRRYCVRYTEPIVPRGCKL